MTPADIRQLKEDLNMTQAEFAKRLGVGTVAVQRWMADETAEYHRKPRGAAITLLAMLRAEADERKRRKSGV